MYFISRYGKLTEVGLQLSWWMRWAVSALFLMGLTALWYVYVYGILHAQLRERARREQQVVEEQMVCKALEQKTNQLQALVNAQKAAWNAQAQALEQSHHDSLFALFDIFLKKGIAIEAYYPRGKVDRAWYTKTSAQIQFSATFEQLLALFAALNSSKIPYVCKEVRLERRAKKIFSIITVSQKIPKVIP